MDDTTRNLPTPADEDPLIHRCLGGLPTYGPPSRHFRDRVLASVRSPTPAWVRRLGERHRELIASGGMWKVVGAIALGALVPTVAAFVSIGIFYADIAWGVGWLLDTGLPFAWERAADEASRALATLRSVAPAGTLSAQWAAVLAALLAGCTFGLVRTMKAKKAITS
jgi:hypothetical protein